MKIKEIENLANLCRIDLSDEEKKELVGEMDSILSFIDQIQEIEAGDVGNRIAKLRNVMRDDEDSHKSGEYTDVILEEVPKREGGYLKVKNIL